MAGLRDLVFMGFHTSSLSRGENARLPRPARRCLSRSCRRPRTLESARRPALVAFPPTAPDFCVSHPPEMKAGHGAPTTTARRVCRETLITTPAARFYYVVDGWMRCYHDDTATLRRPAGVMHLPNTIQPSQQPLEYERAFQQLRSEGAQTFRGE